MYIYTHLQSIARMPITYMQMHAYKLIHGTHMHNVPIVHVLMSHIYDLPKERELSYSYSYRSLLIKTLYLTMRAPAISTHTVIVPNGALSYQLAWKIRASQ